MSSSPTSALPQRQWFRLAVRHLRMATRLSDAGLADGAAFHAYHAYECMLSSFIAARGFDVPPQGWTKMKDATGKTIRFYAGPSSRIQEGSAHKARIILFDQLVDHSKPYFATHNALRRFLGVAMRNDTLYYDPVQNQLPQQRYNRAFISGLLPRVRQFIGQVWIDVR